MTRHITLLAAILLAVTPIDAKLRPRDLIVVHAVTSPHSRDFIHASAGCRTGVRLFAATNDTVYLSNPPGEFWTYYPDEPELIPNGLHPADSRVALAPWLAFNYYGLSFKWILVSSDHTTFLPNAVMSLVRDLDPELPYLLTDDPQWSLETTRQHGSLRTNPPGRHTPTCEPCPPAPAGCSCNATVLCQMPQHAALFEFNCSVPTPVPGVAVPHPSLEGGMLLSLGLLRTVPYMQLRLCVWETPNGGAGPASVLAHCLLQMGISMTVLPPAGPGGTPALNAEVGKGDALLQCMHVLRRRPRDAGCGALVDASASVVVEEVEGMRQLCRAHAMLFGRVHDEM